MFLFIFGNIISFLFFPTCFPNSRAVRTESPAVFPGSGT